MPAPSKYPLVLTYAARSLSSSARTRSHTSQNALTCGLSNDSSIRCASEPGRTETQTETRKDHGMPRVPVARPRSDAARFVSGTALAVDGAATAGLLCPWPTWRHRAACWRDNVG